MLEALFWGLVSSSSLLIGSCIALAFPISRKALGIIMAFAAGVLISAVAYELVLEAVQSYDAEGAGLGLFAGAIVFFLGDALLDRQGAAQRKSAGGADPHSSGLPIVLGTVLDGVPESAVLGLTLIEGQIGLALLVAVFLSNLPEAIAATSGLKTDGWTARRVFNLWGIVVIVSGIAAAAGFGIFDSSSDRVVAFVMAFAAGAILTMLADSMMPEAFDHAGNLAGLVTTLGFATAFAIQGLQ
jgi:ZIP family zinc transporter